MSEVFEALDKLEECAYAMKDLPMSNWIDLAENEVELDLKIMNWVETINFELFKGKQALLELKDIKEVNLGKAMESLERIDKEYATIENEEFKICFNTIKQTLLKAQKQEKENELLKEIIKSLFDKGCPLHQYMDNKFGLTIEVDDECSIMQLGEFKDINLDKKLKEVLEE